MRGQSRRCARAEGGCVASTPPAGVLAAACGAVAVRAKAAAAGGGGRGRRRRLLTERTAVETMSLRALPTTIRTGGAFSARANSTDPMTESAAEHVYPATRTDMRARASVPKMWSIGAKERAHAMVRAFGRVGRSGPPPTPRRSSSICCRYPTCLSCAVESAPRSPRSACPLCDRTSPPLSTLRCMWF